MAREIRIGLIGYKFMGRAHSNAYRQVGAFFDPPLKPRLKAVCGRDERAVREFAARFGWERYTTDWRELVADPEIDLVDIAAPNDLHGPIALAAAEAGKAVFCEKPLARDLPEAKRCSVPWRRPEFLTWSASTIGSSPPSNWPSG
jgi:predicted dehydrogenase